MGDWSSLLFFMFTGSFLPLYAVRLRRCPHSFAYVFIVVS